MGASDRPALASETRALGAPAVVLMVVALAFTASGTAAQATQPSASGTVRASQDGATRTAPAAPLIPYSSRLSLSPGDAESKSDSDLSRTTLAPAPADLGDFDEVVIAPRRTVVLSSQSSWEAGFEALAATFRALDEVVLAAGLDVRGRPFAVFTQTEETGFQFDAMLPVASDGDEAEVREALRQAAAEYAAAPSPAAAADTPVATAEGTAAASPTHVPVENIRLGTSPAGRAFRFVHASAYDDIDAAYEAITTYLDSRSIVVKDAFIEEYVTDLTLPTDESLEVYIYVQPVEEGANASLPIPGEGKPGTPPPAAGTGALE